MRARALAALLSSVMAMACTAPALQGRVCPPAVRAEALPGSGDPSAALRLEIGPVYKQARDYWLPVTLTNVGSTRPVWSNLELQVSTLGARPTHLDNVTLKVVDPAGRPIVPSCFMDRRVLGQSYGVLELGASAHTVLRLDCYAPAQGPVALSAEYEDRNPEPPPPPPGATPFTGRVTSNTVEVDLRRVPPRRGGGSCPEATRP